MNSLQTAVLIPAYNPETLLCRLVQELSAEGFRRIVVVNDGSGESSAEVFRTLEADGLCTVISHAVNTGKGAALKLGLDYLYSRYPECRNIITADADGQHSPEDIRRLAEEAEHHPDCLILGVRSFDRENVPFRSMIGNKTTRLLMRLFLGLAVSDTQTGLRSIPRRLIPDLLKIASNRYEFELEMLILCRRAGIPLREIGIRTIYIDGNSASHFNPLLDSFKIYFVLFRYILSSIVTAVFDFIVFLIVFPLTGSNVLVSTYLSRGAAVCLNYALVKNMVFDSHQKMLRTFPVYILLVCVSGFISAAMVTYMQEYFHLDARIGKPIAELLLYLANFVIQRDFIFQPSGASPDPVPTDWDKYYAAPYKTAGYARRIVGKKLLDMFRRYQPVSHPEIAELGGGNSCFFESIVKSTSPARYVIYDNNALGVRKFEERTAGIPCAAARECNLLELNPEKEKKFDVVFSVGLIEHFPPELTRKMVKVHFDLAEEGGTVILFFPTPTFLYRATRSLSELLRLWIFHDERPLTAEEVETALRPYGTVLHREIIWRNFLTQQIIIARKNNHAGN